MHSQSNNKPVTLFPFEQTATNFQITGIAPNHRAYWMPASGLSLRSTQPETTLSTPDDLCVVFSPKYAGHFDQLRESIQGTTEITLCVRRDSAEAAMIGLLLRQWQIIGNFYVMSADDISPMGLLSAWQNRRHLSDLAALSPATTFALQGIALLDEGATQALRHIGSQRSYSVLRTITMDEYRSVALPAEGADVLIELEDGVIETVRATEPVAHAWKIGAEGMNIEITVRQLVSDAPRQQQAYTTDELVSDMLRIFDLPPSATLRCLQTLCESESLITHPDTVSGQVPGQVFSYRLLTQMSSDYPLLKDADIPEPPECDCGCGIIPVNTYAPLRANQLGREYKIIYRAICDRYVEACLGTAAEPYVELTCTLNGIRCRGVLLSQNLADLSVLTGKVLDVELILNATNEISPDNWQYLNSRGYCGGKFPVPKSRAFSGQLDRGMIRFIPDKNALTIPNMYLDGLPDAIVDSEGLSEWIDYLLFARRTGDPRQVMINWLAFVRSKITQIG